MPFADVDGAVIHYRLDGDDGLPALVLSNGLGTDLSAWDCQVPLLSDAFRVLRYDTRGHGASSTPPSAFSMEQLGRDVLTLLDALAISRAHFCGLSLGGMTGMWLGIHAPHRLESLTLANTAARVGPSTMWNARIDAVMTAGMASISDAAVARWFTPRFVAEKRELVSNVKGAMERTSPQGYVQCCAAIRDADFTDEVARIAVPVLVINGTHDVATPPADGLFLAQQIPGAQAVALDAAHLSNIEAPLLFAEALRSFCLVSAACGRELHP